ncbi:MAG: hypothetical protein K0Q87_402 [Neobacillus sp.]|jgi:hypothetical protein|nr:hypothetical protein [Neobacillus sp.]
MGWSTKPPTKDGWYLVTLADGTVMPALRVEYPKGNFSWQHLACNAQVLAAMKFPKAYTVTC